MEFFFYGGKLLVLDLADYRWLKPKNDAIFEAAKALKLKELFDAHSNSMKYISVAKHFVLFCNFFMKPPKIAKIEWNLQLDPMYLLHTMSSVYL